MTETAIIPDGSRVFVRADLEWGGFPEDDAIRIGAAIVLRSKVISQRQAYWVRMDDDGQEFWASADEVTFDAS